MIALMAVMSMGAFAQDGKFAVGANVGFAAYGNSYNPFGLGAKFQYEFVENVRAEVAYNYWFPKDKAGVMDFNLNFQYLIPVAEGLKVYPIAGATLAMTHGKAYKYLLDKQQTMFGFNAGAGIEYYVASNLKLNLDIKYQYNKKTKNGYELKIDGPIFQAGFAYCF